MIMAGRGKPAVAKPTARAGRVNAVGGRGDRLGRGGRTGPNAGGRGGYGTSHGADEYRGKPPFRQWGDRGEEAREAGSGSMEVVGVMVQTTGIGTSRHPWGTS